MGGVPSTRAPRQPRERWLIVVVAVLLASAFAVIAAILLSPSPPDADGQRRLANWLAAVHQTWMPRWVTFGLVEFSSNVVMFLPLGFLGAIVFSRARWAVFAACVAFSTLVELVQWALLPARQADWRDVLANSLGAAIGIALVAGVPRVFGRRAAGSRTVGQRE